MTAFRPELKALHIGSMPHLDARKACDLALQHFPDIPAWPQFSRRTFRENMYVQYTASLPRMVLDEAHEKITADTTGDLTPDLEAFYERYLAEDIESDTRDGDMDLNILIRTMLHEGNRISLRAGA